MQNKKENEIVRKLMTGLLVFAFSVIIAGNVTTDGNKVFAAGEVEYAVSDDFITVTYDADEANNLISNKTVPEQAAGYEDWVFAGWYTTNECTTPIKTDGNTDTCYAKFVPKEVLSVKCQVPVDTTAESEKANLRFVTTVDTANYSSMGFEITRSGKSYSSNTQTAFKRIVASSESGVDFEYSPKAIDTKSEAFVTYTITGIPKSAFDTELLVKPYWVTLDGTTVYGVSRYVTVADYYNSVVNIPVEVTPSESETTYESSFAVNEGSNEVAEPNVAVRYNANENYASVVLSNKSSLSSATKYTVTDGTTTTTYVHRNFLTSYNGSNADTSWYTVAKELDDTENEFVIATSADLYGVASYVNGQTKVDDSLELFADKTIYVVSDIAINADDSVNWETGIVTEGATTYPWTPIGSNTTNYFAGTFDGQGHTISGLYYSGDALNVGLFGYAHPYSTIQNVAVKKSYFQYVPAGNDTTDAGAATGSIVGVGNGTVSNVFSSATVEGKYNVGGIVGCITDGYNQRRSNEKISDCWFDGKVVSGNGYNVGGMLGKIQGSQNLIPDLSIINCLNSGELSTTNTSVGRVAGMVGCANQYCTVKISCCMNNGTLSGNSKAISGMVAYKGTGVTINLGEGIYRTDATTYTNVADCDTTVITRQTDICGYSALKNTDALDFNSVWIARKDATPVLKNWVTEDALYTPDTSFTQTASGTEDAPYQIRTPQQFYGMAYLINGEDGASYEGKHFKIAKDIKINAGAAENWETDAPKYTWIPIDEFKGTLDGGKNAVTGVYCSSTVENTGLIRKTTLNSTIENLKLENSYITSTQMATGSVVGLATGTISNVFSDAIVNGTANAGGIAGYVLFDDTNAESKAIFTGCWFDGTVKADNIHVGGILGGVNMSGSPTVIEHCLNTGNVSSSDTAHGRVGGLCGNVNGNAAGLTIRDSLNTGVVEGKKNTGSVIGIVQGGTVTTENTYAIATSDMNGVGSNTVTTGAIYCLLEADMTGEVACQTMNLDFANNWTYADGTPELQWLSGKAEGMTSVEKVIDLSWYANPNEAGEYVITNEKQLYGLSYIQDYSGFKGKTIKLNAEDGVFEMNIGNAVDWNAGTVGEDVRAWRPIENFAGIFNGQKNTISGIYIADMTTNTGLFANTTSGASVQDIIVENSYLHSKTTDGSTSSIGSIVGNPVSTTIEKVYVTDTVYLKAPGYVGGIAGLANGCTIKENWFDGTISSTSYATGGIVGRVFNTTLTLENCLFSGSLSGTTSQVAGLCGNATASGKTISISNCLSVGTIKSTSTDYAVGWTNATVSTTNSYAKSGIATGNLASLTTKTEVQLTGFDPYVSTNEIALQFDDPSSQENTNDGKWIAKAYGTPELRYFAETGLYKPNMSMQATNVDGKSVYTISNVADLYGISYLSAINSETFANATITLEDKVIVNTLAEDDKVSDWETDAPAYEWIPIGQTTAFQGTFDGNGKTVAGIYCSSNTDNVGLFGQTTNSTIKDFEIHNSYFSISKTGEYGVGSVVGVGNGRLERIYSTAIVKGADSNNGGIVGTYQAGTDNVISECWFGGSVTGAAYSTGGIVGKINDCTLTIEHCLTDGSVKGNNRAGGLCGDVNTNASLKVRDSLHTGTLEATANSGAIAGNCGTTVDVGSYTTHAIADTQSTTGISGQLVVGADINGQKGYDNTQLIFDRPETEDVEEGKWVTRKEDTPALKYFVDEKDVYEFNGYRAAKAWHNDPVKEGTYDVYEIDTVDELLGVSALVADGNTCFTNEKIMVTADIAVNPKESVDWSTGEVNDDMVVSWIPIGSSTTKYFAGILDGGDHTISGLYYKSTGNGVGLVGVLHPDGVVQNLKLKDSFFESTNGWYIGSIAGYGNGSVINVYSNATVKGAYNSGGIIGQVHGEWWYGDTDGRTVSNCWYEGNVIVENIHAGGIIGTVNGKTNNANTYNIDVTIEHCLNTGNITAVATNNSRAGGLIGNVQGGAPSITITDCLNTGTIKGNSESGSALGIVQTGTVTVTDVYTASDSASNPVGSGSGKVSGTINNSYAKSGMKGYALCTANTLNIETKSGLDFYVNNADSEDKAYWTAKVDGTPTLKYFDDAGLYEMDINWIGEGTLESPYTIFSVAELYGLAMLSNANDFSTKYIQLDESVSILEVNTGDASDYENNKPKFDWIPIGGLNATKTFKGNFDGNGVTISGLYCDMTGNHTGLFAATNGCTIQNFSLVNSYFATAKNYAGSISSHATDISVSNVYSDAIVNCAGVLAGGLLGDVAGTTSSIQGCWFAGVLEDTNLTNESNYSHVGGLIGKVQIDVALTMNNSLNSGKVVGAKRVGGLVGDANFNATLNFTNCMNTGELDGTDTIYTTVNKQSATDEAEAVDASVGAAGYPAGSLVGYVTATQTDNSGEVTGNATKVTFTNTFGVNDDASFAIGNNVITVNSSDITGEVTMGARSALLGYAELINQENSAWVLTEVAGELTVGLAQFVPEEERFSDSELNGLLALGTLSTTISTAEDKGDGNYVISIPDTSNLYTTYVEALQSETRGFTLKANNADTTLNTEGTYNAVLTRGDWVVSVTHVGNSVNKTYVTISCTGQEVSPHLNETVEYGTPEDATLKGYTATSDLNVSFHMLQKCWTYGNGFVIQLKNGHFIVIDGGVEQELPYILDYMDSLVDQGTVPIVEAWVISHTHRDHIGALIELIKYSKEGYATQGSSGDNTYYGDRLYVEGIYYSEVAQEMLEKEDAERVAYKYQYNTIIEQASEVLKSTTGEGTKIYRPQAGQRYYFDGVTMDIILTQEQMSITPGDTDTNVQTINDTSTWCMFTIDAGNSTTKKILCGGDGYERNMQYLVNAFAANTTYFDVDIMTALHHGANKYDTFMALCDVKEVVLFDRSKLNESLGIDSLSSEYKNYSALISGASSGYKKSGDGNVVVTFKDGTIAINQNKRTEWKYCQPLY